MLCSLIMWMFAVFFTPIMLALYLLTHRGTANRFAVVMGLFMGACFCIFAILFSSGYRMYPASFLGIFFPVFLYEVFLPSSVLTVIVLVFFKDGLSIRSSALMPVFLGFFCLYAPFRIFFRSEILAGFTLFLKPVMLFSCVTGVVCTLELLIGRLAHVGQNKKKEKLALAPVVCGGISAVAPAMAEACWYSNMSFVLYVGLGALGICTTIFLLACSHKGQCSS